MKTYLFILLPIIFTIGCNDNTSSNESNYGSITLRTDSLAYKESSDGQKIKYTMSNGTASTIYSHGQQNRAILQLLYKDGSKWIGHSLFPIDFYSNPSKISVISVNSFSIAIDSSVYSYEKGVYKLQYNYSPDSVVAEGSVVLSNEFEIK